MEYPRLTPEQILLNNMEFNNIIENLREISPLVADLLMMNRSKLDRHLNAQESELKIMDRRDRCG